VASPGQDMPRHRWPLTPPTDAPTAAVAMIAGGNKMPISAPTAAPPHAHYKISRQVLAAAGATDDLPRIADAALQRS
jgi:hypothetical protein